MTARTGSSGDDILNGFNRTDDEISGRGGDDTIRGFGGDDSLSGDGGNDSLVGDGGNDTLLGGSGNDTLRGGSGMDRVSGGNGDDDLSSDGTGTLNGGRGNDLISTLVGVVQMLGGAGNDELDANATASTLRGGAGNDTLSGRETGEDMLSGAMLFGDAGNDSLIAVGVTEAHGGAGHDRVELSGFGVLVDGGSGDDSLTSAIDTLFGEDGVGFGPGDTIDGGSGADVLFYEETDIRVAFAVDMEAGTVRKSGSFTTDEGDEPRDMGTDVIRGIETVITLNEDDVLRGSSRAEALSGLGGDDLIFGRGGADLLRGGLGDDVLNGGAGFDFASYDTAFVFGGDERPPRTGEGVVVDLAGGTSSGIWGEDRLVSIEGLVGSEDGDVLRGNSGINYIDGSEGSDTLDGRGGTDTLFGGDGRDVLIGGRGADLLSADAGIDTITGGRGGDLFVFASFSKVNVVTDFGRGNDKILLGAGDLVTRPAAFLRAGEQVEDDVVFAFGRSQLVLQDTVLEDIGVDDILVITEEEALALLA